MVSSVKSPYKRRKRTQRLKQRSENTATSAQGSRPAVCHNPELPPSSACDILQALWQVTSLPSSGEIASMVRKEKDPTSPDKSPSSDGVQTGTKTALQSQSKSTSRRTRISSKRSLPALRAEHSKTVDSAKLGSRPGWIRSLSDSYDIKKLRNLRRPDSEVEETESRITTAAENIDEFLAAAVQKHREVIQVLRSHERDEDLTWLRYVIEDL